jgi:DGQHR domain-containing protein
VAASASKKSSNKKKKPKELTPEQKHKAEKRAFARSIQTILDRMGFVRCPSLSDIPIEFDGRQGDFDDAFVHENLVVFVEYTVSNQSQVGDHIKGKAHLFAKILSDPLGFVQHMIENFPDLKSSVPSSYHPSQLQVRILYCSKSEIKKEHQELALGTSFLWYQSIRYFADLSAAIKRSARFEFFDFLKIAHGDVGASGVIPQGSPAVGFAGSVLPEPHSNFPSGFKVISFYVSPGAVLSRAYVLRHDGWRDSEGLYQRMINRKKIESIRKYLRENERVFVNNVILTLPDDTKLLDANSQDVDPKTILKTKPITVQLPDRGNTVGIIDGQHRIFSYYEDATADAKIDVYRTRQNLLATGIMYPPGYTGDARERFEASLFLEINSTQNAAASPLKQAIAVITQPFSPDSVGKRVVQRLADLSALKDKLERSFYDQGVLRTATIVSYGLRPLVRVEAEDGLFRHWGTVEQRAEVQAGNDVSSLNEYTDFAAREINKFISAAKANLAAGAWQLKAKDGPGLLTVTFVNGLLVLFRHYARMKGLGTFAQYNDALKNLGTFGFADYKSSRYFALGTDLYKHLFGVDPAAD